LAVHSKNWRWSSRSYYEKDEEFDRTVGPTSDSDLRGAPSFAFLFWKGGAFDAWPGLSPGISGEGGRVANPLSREGFEGALSPASSEAGLCGL
jgi:hypothetical protein